MTSFVTKDGSLILKNGKLLIGDPSCCCTKRSACCIANGYGNHICQDVLSESECKNSSEGYNTGTEYYDNISCSEGACAACCIPVNNEWGGSFCQSGLSESECQARGGTFDASISCLDITACL